MFRATSHFARSAAVVMIPTSPRPWAAGEMRAPLVKAPSIHRYPDARCGKTANTSLMQSQSSRAAEYALLHELVIRPTADLFDYDAEHKRPCAIRPSGQEQISAGTHRAPSKSPRWSGFAGKSPVSSSQSCLTPAVWFINCRMVIAFQDGGASERNLATGSSSPSFPSSARSRMAASVNCLVIDAISNLVSSVTGTFSSTSASLHVRA